MAVNNNYMNVSLTPVELRKMGVDSLFFAKDELIPLKILNSYDRGIVIRYLEKEAEEKQQEEFEEEQENE